MESNLNPRNFLCKFCNSNFNQKGNLKIHIKRLHTNFKKDGLKCLYCSCIFKSVGSLNSHISRKHCKQVKDNSFTNLKSQLVIDLQRLQIFYTRNNIKQADTLLKQIINNSNITGELLKSTIEDNIEKIELNSYIDLNAILELKKVNSDNNASEINVNDTENKNNSLITSLMDSTTGIVKQYQIKKQGSKNYYLCNYCKKEFGKPSDLIRHVRTHTLEKPFKCEICSTCFTVKSTLNAHMKIHDQHSGNSKKIRNYLMSSEDGKEKEAEKCTKQKETCETSVESSLNYEIDESQSDDGDEFKTELISIQPNLLRPSLSRVHDNDLKEII